MVGTMWSYFPLSPKKEGRASQILSKEHFHQNSREKLYDLYCKEVRRTQCAEKSSEQDLIEKAQKGCKVSRDKVVSSHLKLVLKIANKYTNRGVEILDLIEEGNLGLLHAIEKFDPSQNCQFSTYAFLWIRQNIEQLLMKQTQDIRLPANIFKKINAFKKLKKEVGDFLERKPKTQEIATINNLCPKELEKISSIEKNVSVLSEQTGELSKISLFEKIENVEQYNPESDSSFEEESQILLELIQRLPEKNKDIIIKRYGLGRCKEQTLRQISEDLQVSAERVRQIQEESISKLRALMTEKKLKSSDYFGPTH